jgi:hypothetical protein
MIDDMLLNDKRLLADIAEQIRIFPDKELPLELMELLNKWLIKLGSTLTSSVEWVPSSDQSPSPFWLLSKQARNEFLLFIALGALQAISLEKRRGYESRNFASIH